MIPVAVLAGLCEGSGMALDPEQPDTVLIADNEQAGELFRYTLDGVPLGSVGGLDLAGVKLGTRVEDIEALAVDATDVWVVGSHSRSKSGERRPERERILQVHSGTSTVWTIDWEKCTACQADTFEAERNVEGAAFWTAHLWLGLRAPLLDGRSLLVELTPKAGTTTFEVSGAYPLDLGGMAIVDLAVQPGRPDLLWILAGASTGKAAPVVFELPGPLATPKRHLLALPEDAEGIVVLANGGARVVTDGATAKGAVPGESVCKTTSTFYRSDKL